MGAKRYVKVNGDRIYGYTELLARRKDAVVLTATEVKAWRKSQEQGATAIPESTPKRKRATQPKTMVSDSVVDPEDILEVLRDGDNLPTGD